MKTLLRFLAVLVLVSFLTLIAVMLGPAFGLAVISTLVLVGAVYVIIEWIHEAQESPYDKDCR